MLEYMAGMLEEGDTEDLAEGLTEFLDEYAESDEAKIAALITTIRYVHACISIQYSSVLPDTLCPLPGV